MSEPTLPNLSERVFRTYERHIARAVAAWPKETQFDRADMKDLDGNPLSVHTFIARFRDSIRSVLKYGWSTDIDILKLRGMGNVYALAYGDAGTAWFKHRGQRGRPTTGVMDTRAQGPSNLDADVDRAPWKDVSEAELRSLCILIHTKRILGPIVIEQEFPPELVEDVTSGYDVGLVFHRERGQTVVT